jgi:HK97 family phage major capsid protein
MTLLRCHPFVSNRAYSFLEIKAVDRAQRVIEGIASTPEVDRGGDVMVPAGAKFNLPMPFLWEHGAPIGEVFAADVKADGIYIKARLSQVEPSAPAALKDRLAMAWASISANPPLVRGLSIGWAPLKVAALAGVKGGRLISEWIWGETSAVVVPMNAGARITNVKSLAQFARTLAASGASSGSSIPGAAGSLQEQQHMTTSEQLTAEKAALQTKTSRLAELMADETTNGGLTAEETTERDGLVAEVKSLTSKVANLTALEQAQAGLATGVIAPGPAAAAPARRQPAMDVKTIELPKGTIFTRACLAVAAGRGSRADTIEYAKRFTNTPEVLAFIKSEAWQAKTAAVGQATFESPGWGSQLVNPGQVTAEFIELLMPRTIIGKVQGFDRIPFNTLIIEQTGGSTFQWVGEASPKPVGELAFDKTSLAFSKVAGIVVLSDELVRLSLPSAEAKARADLVAQCAKFLDQQFIRVANAPSGSNPGSITYGVSSPSATGVTAAALLHDLNIALQTFDTLNEDDGNLAIATTPALARGISLLQTTLGVQAFPGMTPQGGTLLGYPVIVSSSVDSGTVVVFKPSDIYLADDGQVTIDASREATLDMSGSTTATFNLWQNNCVGLRAERWIRWQKKREAVAVIDTAAYAPA